MSITLPAHAKQCQAMFLSNEQQQQQQQRQQRQQRQRQQRQQQQQNPKGLMEFAPLLSFLFAFQSTVF